MKKKLLSVVLAASMVMSMAACGSSNSASSTSSTETKTETKTETTTETKTETTTVETAEEGSVLNIYVWNDEFISRVTDFYPGYEKVDNTTGKIGDVTVKWNQTPNENLAYQNNLDETLLKQDKAAADDKIDIFLIEADYALKYVDSDFTMPLADLGITAADLKDQYKYTQDIVTDSNGVLKGSSWQGCPGALFYNRLAAKEIFGTDDAAEIQALVKDWDTFTATAEKVTAAGYQMVSSVNDTYRVYSNNVSSKWVEDGKLNIDANLLKWVDDSKALHDMNAAGTHDLWGDDWSKGFYPEGKVFCYFGPAWLINFCMAADVDGSLANTGNFGIAEGPQGFYWGGTWICAATGTDNPTLVKDIMMQLTGNAEVMKQIVIGADDFVNNVPAMEDMAKDTSYSSKVLGGVNPLGTYLEGAKSIDLSNASAYDQGCNENFQRAMKNYFEGNATKEEAIELFKKNIKDIYPDVNVD